MDEFALIRHYFHALGAQRADVLLGIGDDCALLHPPGDEVLAVSTDTLIAGRHFPLNTAAADIGWKALAVNLSDLAAMGATPRWFTLALSLPMVDQAWLAEFARGLAELAQQSGIALVGGDTTRGALSLTLTVIGSVPAAQALRRDGARVGDLVCITGTLGDAALALRDLELADCPAELRQRLNRPQPRVSAGLALRGRAHAAIDLSDGLAGDLLHVLSASGVGAQLRADLLPMSPIFAARTTAADRLALQAQCGDDYELCVCLPPDAVAEVSSRLDVPLSVIGRITAQPGLRITSADGVTIPLSPHGYRHFP